MGEVIENESYKKVKFKKNFFLGIELRTKEIRREAKNAPFLNH